MPKQGSKPVASERILDAQGLYCPEPVMMLHNMIREMETGETVRIIATDPSTRRDIPKFCNFLGHVLVETSEDTRAQTFSYVIRKQESAR